MTVHWYKFILPRSYVHHYKHGRQSSHEKVCSSHSPSHLLSQMNVISHKKSTRYRAYVMEIVLRMGLIKPVCDEKVEEAGRDVNEIWYIARNGSLPYLPKHVIKPYIRTEIVTWQVPISPKQVSMMIRSPFVPAPHKLVHILRFVCIACVKIEQTIR